MKNVILNYKHIQVEWVAAIVHNWTYLWLFNICWGDIVILIVWYKVR